MTKKTMRAGEDITERNDSPTASPAVSHAQHSPLPWREGPTDGIGQRGRLRVVDANGVQVADFEAPKTTPTAFVRHLPEDTANVALALRACNHHEALLAALKRADGFITNGIELGFIRMPDANVPDPAKEVPGIVRAAIAKVEGN